MSRDASESESRYESKEYRGGTTLGPFVPVPCFDLRSNREYIFADGGDGFGVSASSRIILVQQIQDLGCHREGLICPSCSYERRIELRFV